MTTYDVIDAHVHTYKTPDIGRQALSGFENAGCCGVPEELVPIMEEELQLIRRIGVDRVMFGSDYLWFHPLWDLKRFLKLDFTDDEKRPY